MKTTLCPNLQENKLNYDIVIIGAGTAGLTAAIYAARAGKKVLILENESIGGQIATSPKVENYPGFSEISGMEFSDRLYEQASALGVELELDKAEKITDNGDNKTVKTEYGEFTCKAVIIATGVKHRHLGIEAEEKYMGRGVSYCAVCDGAFYKGKDVAVVGGGNSAVQSAIMLSNICNKVYLIHRRDEFRCEKKLSDEVRAIENIELVLSSTVQDLKGEDKLTTVITENKSGETEEISAEGLFVLVGQIPENGAFADIITLDESGYIVAGEDCKTNVDGVFAAGDCRTKAIRQLTTAAADGSVAALAACSM
ncbi:MAG: thioredoxin-disulfide reductase [Clostridia bacterium]|nr:thioredoxin-disulfide reductase [Clostridia bacterium]